MNETSTATYDSEETLVNVADDLVSTGIPREKIHVDKSSKVVKVIAPQTSTPEIVEILKRHQPTSVESHPLTESAS